LLSVDLISLILPRHVPPTVISIVIPNQAVQPDMFQLVGKALHRAIYLDLRTIQKRPDSHPDL
jgi:hypothetical protein